MNVTEILSLIDSEIIRLQQARAVLTDGSRVNRRGKKRTMSAEGRARIAAAQKRRWAKQKAAKKAA